MDALKSRIPVGEDYIINQAETDISSQDQSKGDIYQYIYKLQVAVNQAFIFTPDNHFSAYLERLSSPLDCAIADDGGAYTNETTAANDAGAGDMTLLPAVEAINDAYYFGYRFPFSCLAITISQAGVGTAVTWEYYNGAAWVALAGLTDGTSGLTAAAGTHNVTFIPPSDWAEVAVNSITMYWIRVRCTAASFTTQPLATRAYIGYGVECDGTDMMRLRLESADTRRSRILWEGRYSEIKEFAEDSKLRRLTIDEPVRADAGDILYLEPKCRGGLIDVSECYFELSCKRVRASMYGAS